MKLQRYFANHNWFYYSGSFRTVLSYGALRIGQFSFGGYLQANFLFSINSFGGKLDFGNPPRDINGMHTYLSDAVRQPARFVKKRLNAVWELWGPWPLDDAERSSVVRALIGLRSLLLLLAMVALFKVRLFEISVVLLSPALVRTMVHTVFFGNSRYMYPAEPLLIVSATLGVAQLLRRQTGPPALRAKCTVTASCNSRADKHGGVRPRGEC